MFMPVKGAEVSAPLLARLAAGWASRAARTAAGSSTTPEDKGTPSDIVEMLPRVGVLLPGRGLQPGLGSLHLGFGSL